MSTFTRRSYDKQELEYFDKTNNKFNNQRLDINPFENRNNCVNPFVPNQGANLSRPLNNEGFLNQGNKTQIESTLRNQHLPLNSQLRNNQDYDKIQRSNIKMCNITENFVNEDSRVSHPINNFREMSTTSLAYSPYLFMNPQEVTANNDSQMLPNRNGVNTRLDAKREGYNASNIKEYKKLVSNKNTSLKDFQNEVSSLLITSRKSKK
jgi:hypothetical protein